MESIIQNIETKNWNQILHKLIESEWKTTYKYDNFDAGIDCHFIILKKGSDEIIFDWTNWDEGSIICSKKNIDIINQFSTQTLEIGDSKDINYQHIRQHKKWQKENTWNNQNDNGLVEISINQNNKKWFEFWK